MLEPSGFYYPNRIARAYLRGMQATLGPGDYANVLDITELAEYLAELPPDTMARQFDFVYFSALNRGLEDIFGARGGRSMALRIGRAWFDEGMNKFGAFAGLSHEAFQALPLQRRAQMALQALVAVFTQYTDQITQLRDQDDYYEISIDTSPMIWGRQTDLPVCHSLAGLFQATLLAASAGHEYHVVEIGCHAAGSDLCIFHINKKPIGQR